MKRLLSLFLLCAVSTAVPMQSQFVEWAKNIEVKQGLQALTADAQKVASATGEVFGNATSAAADALKSENISSYLEQVQQFINAYPGAVLLTGLSSIVLTAFLVDYFKHNQDTGAATNWPKKSSEVKMASSLCMLSMLGIFLATVGFAHLQTNS